MYIHLEDTSTIADKSYLHSMQYEIIWIEKTFGLFSSKKEQVIASGKLGVSKSIQQNFYVDTSLLKTYNYEIQVRFTTDFSMCLSLPEYNKIIVEDYPKNGKYFRPVFIRKNILIPFSAKRTQTDSMKNASIRVLNINYYQTAFDSLKKELNFQNTTNVAASIDTWMKILVYKQKGNYPELVKYDSVYITPNTSGITYEY
jgi:hypothetical protein